MDYQDYKRVNDALEFQYKSNGCSDSVLRIVNVDISKGLCQLNTGTVTYISNLVAYTMMGMGCVSNPSAIAQWTGYNKMGNPSVQQAQQPMHLEFDEGIEIPEFVKRGHAVYTKEDNEIIDACMGVEDDPNYTDEQQKADLGAILRKKVK